MPRLIEPCRTRSLSTTDAFSRGEFGEGVDDSPHHEGQIRQLGRSAHLVDCLVVDLDGDQRVG